MVTRQEQIDALPGIIENRTPEGLELEFKRKHDPTSADLNKEDKKDLGEALLGFANSVGGKLLIGIVSQTIADEDVAVGFQCLRPLDQLRSKYESLVHQYLSPSLPGVVVNGIELEPNAGIIEIIIPRGERRPYMSLAPGHQKYFRRTHDNFRPLDHYEVEDMFRIRSAPDLELVLEFHEDGMVGESRLSAIKFGLRNVSNETAKFPFICYHGSTQAPPLAEYGLDGNGNVAWSKSVSGSMNGTTFSGGANDVLHPGQLIFISKLSLCDSATNTYRSRYIVEEMPEVVSFSFDFGCEGMRLKTRSLLLRRDEILGRNFPNGVFDNWAR